jgi:hypothetical protein
MSASNSFENGILLLVFNNTNFALIGDATGLRGSSTAGSLYVSLHTSDPGEAGDQTTNEAAYTSYARVAVARSGAGWTVSTNTATNTAAIDFPACTGSSSTCTYFGVGTALTSTGVLLFSGALTASLAVSTGVTPEFAIGQLSVSAD